MLLTWPIYHNTGIGSHPTNLIGNQYRYRFISNQLERFIIISITSKQLDLFNISDIGWHPTNLTDLSLQTSVHIRLTWPVYHCRYRFTSRLVRRLVSVVEPEVVNPHSLWACSVWSTCLKEKSRLTDTTQPTCRYWLWGAVWRWSHRTRCCSMELSGICADQLVSENLSNVL